MVRAFGDERFYDSGQAEMVRRPEWKAYKEAGGEFTDIRQFNCMFKTSVGPVEDSGSVAYLRS